MNRLPEAETARLCVEQVVGSIEMQSAGPTYSVSRLCGALAHQGHAVRLRSLGVQQRSETEAPYRDLRYPWELVNLPVLGKLGRSRPLRRALMDGAGEAHVVHAHGLWRLPNVYSADAARKAAKPFVLSPRGMLAPSALKFSALSKRIFWAMAQGRAVHSVSAFHATSEQEYRNIRAAGLKQPVAVIPNGVDMPEISANENKEANAPCVLFLGRLHPINGGRARPPADTFGCRSRLPLRKDAAHEIRSRSSRARHATPTKPRGLEGLG